MGYKYAPPLITSFLTSFYDFAVDLMGVGKVLQFKVIKVAKIKGNEKILDVGCGTGTLVIILKQKFPHLDITAIDPSEEAIRIARKKAQNKKLEINFINSSVENLSKDSREFDLIFSTLSFHHMPLEIKKQGLNEIYKILNKNGRLILVDIGKPINLFWNFILSVESIIEPREYIKDNLNGAIPNLMRNAGYKLSELQKPYRGIWFWEGTKPN